MTVPEQLDAISEKLDCITERIGELRVAAGEHGRELVHHAHRIGALEAEVDSTRDKLIRHKLGTVEHERDSLVESRRHYSRWAIGIVALVIINGCSALGGAVLSRYVDAPLAQKGTK